MPTENTVGKAAAQAPQFSVLAESQPEEIHAAALEVLRHTGIRFHHRQALEMLQKAGADLSDDTLVRFPPQLVADAPGFSAWRDRHVRSRWRAGDVPGR